MQIQIDQARLLGELQALAKLTDAEPASEGVAVTRIVFSADDLRARAWLKDLAKAEGFEIRDDAVGNIFMRWTGTEPDLPAIATGSHTDAIPYAGMYDGTVGVLGGLEAMRALKRSGLRPRRSIELVMFTSEEPTRFGIGCLGSRLLSGTLDPDRADALQDKDEAPLSAVRTAAGFVGPLSSVRLPPNHYHA
jgi:ureidoglycolate amidohydrolase